MPLTEEQLRAINHRDRKSFSHAYDLRKPYGGLDGVLLWCKSECRGDWRWELVEVATDKRDGWYIFYFDLDLDFTAFLLKWG